MDERMDGSTEKPYLIRLSLYIWCKSSINLKQKCQHAFAGWKFNKRKFRNETKLTELRIKTCTYSTDVSCWCPTSKI